MNIFERQCTTFEVSRKEKQYYAWSYPIFKHKNVWETYVLDNLLLKSSPIMKYFANEDIVTLEVTVDDVRILFMEVSHTFGNVNC